VGHSWTGEIQNHHQCVLQRLLCHRHSLRHLERSDCGLSQESFREITTYWLNEINNYAEPKVKILLIGNKSDCEDRKVETARGQQLAEKYGWLFFECSAKKGDNVTAAFLEMSRLLIKEK